MIWKSTYPEVIIPSNVSFMEYFFHALHRVDPNHVALVNASGGPALTFQDLIRNIKLLASALTARNIKKGDIVALCALNSKEYLIAMLAVFACGATVTTCNPYSTEDEMMLLFQQSKPKVAFVHHTTFSAMKNVADKLKGIQMIVTFQVMPGVLSYDDLLQSGDMTDYPTNFAIEPKEDVIFLPYSSGTTGLPKGVMVTHYSLIATQELYRLWKRATYDDCYYSVLPMYHIYGMTMSILALLIGAKHIVDERFDVKRTLDIISKEKVTIFNAVPPMILQMAKYPEVSNYDLTSLKLVHSGAAPLGKNLPDLLKDKTGMHVCQGWGLTEMLPIVAGSNDIYRVPSDSVGFVAPNTEVKIVESSTGKELACNEEGEICARGPQLMKGYYNNLNATRAAISTEGWFRTGDIGRMDECGRLYVVDRLKELIKYKGFQVAPAELESVLLHHPGVLDAAVIGIPHPEAGEVPKAFVVLKDKITTTKEIDEFVQRMLDHAKSCDSTYLTQVTCPSTSICEEE